MVRLIETTSAPIFDVDGDGNISGWNDKMGELTGLPLLEAVGVPLVNLVVNESVNEVKAMLSSALQGNIFWSRFILFLLLFLVIVSLFRRSFLICVLAV